MPDGTTQAPKRKEKYLRRQKEIYAAAAQVFAERGYHGASTTEIAKRLGIAQSTLYHYFTSKDEALEKVCLLGLEGYLDRIILIVDGSGDAKSKIRAAIRSHIEPALSIPDIVRTFHLERRFLPEQRRQKINADIDVYHRHLEQILRAGVETGELRSDLNCAVTTLLLISQCNSAQTWINRNGLEEISHSISEIMLNGILPPEIKVN